MRTLGRAVYTVGKRIRGTGQIIQGGLRTEEQGNHPSLNFENPSVLSVGGLANVLAQWRSCKILSLGSPNGVEL